MKELIMNQKSSFLILVSLIIFFATSLSYAFDLQKGLPSHVKEGIKNQIETIIGTSDFKGIPLLDSVTNWDDYNVWPDEFTFNGNKLELDFSAPGLTHPSKGVRPRPKKIPQDTPVELTYLTTNPYAAPYIRPFSFWRPNGFIREKRVLFQSERSVQLVFECGFYVSGELLSYGRDDLKMNRGIDDYFDKKGKNVATYILPHDNSGPIFLVNDHQTDVNTFNKMMDQLNQDNPGGEDFPLAYVSLDDPSQGKIL